MLVRTKYIFLATGMLAALLLCSCSMFYKTTVKSPASSSSSESPLLVSAPAENALGQSFLSQVKKAKESNRDTVGWLYVPGTEINNSVLQAFDNSYYIRRDENRKDSIYGCYFADYENALDHSAEFSRNTIIYGHSDLKDNPDGKRFSQLFRFIGEAFAKETPHIYFSTPEEDLAFRVFAVFYAETSFQYILADPDDATFMNIVAKARDGSIYEYDVDVTKDDKILTLSTCSVKHGDDSTHRLVVMARLLREGESYEDNLKAPAVRNVSSPVQ